MPPVATAEFQRALSGLAASSSRSVTKLLARLDRLTVPEALGFISDAYPVVIDPYLRGSAELTTQWYAEQPARPVRRGAAVFVPEAAPLIERDRLAASARWAVLQRDPVSALSGSATRSIFDQARRPVLANVRREKVKWARYASASACGFCRMLATREAVYASEGNALKSHDNCFCLATPCRDGVWNPPAYVEQWREDYDAAREAGATTAGEIARAMDPGRETRAAGRPKPSGTPKAHVDAPSPETASGPDGPKGPTKPPIGGQSVRADDEPPRRRGSVDRSEVKHVYQHELDVAAKLAELGEDVKFLPRPQNDRGADIQVGGEQWEIKSPTSSNRNTIVSRLGRGVGQAPRLVFSLMRTTISVEDAASMAREALGKYSGIDAIRLIGRDTPDGPLDMMIGR